ncbi:putative restriction endonuclease [Promicromonospora umidemergens]|uniref:HNH nuclease domain-containing protein n=1 Tax=Promicromonospora umidemergens TaxID=629679 RepID=A0ABP8XDE6_9MICO|nr:HNH endonuclease [Promicromonospora umidemergens]MCP2281627.1 putative restriction endonuclease [Promicromonospora umidemergens]
MTGPGERAYVGVTDNAWAAFLHARPDLAEVNFWLPTPSASFKAIGRGDPFLFKTHYPANRLVGGGFLMEYRILTVSEAWRFFGEGNGVASVDALRDAIVRFRTRSANPVGPGEDPRIGCIILGGVFFADDEASLAAPSDFAGNIVRGKSYPRAAGSYVEDALWRLLESSGGLRMPGDAGLPTVIRGPVFREQPGLVQVRAGQRQFRAAVTVAYDRTCAVTGNRISAALEAAHIRPVAAAGQNRVDNGLLLRSDVHALYDAGYLGLDAGYRLQVSPRLRQDTGNGDWYYGRAGAELLVPERRADRPDPVALEWHMDEVFRRAA